jgi:hypothetical protein
MVSVASQLTEEVTAHAQSDSLKEAREMCADGTYFLNNLRILESTQITFVDVCFFESTSNKVSRTYKTSRVSLSRQELQQLQFCYYQ